MTRAPRGVASRAKGGPLPPASDPRWYQDAVVYEVHVRAFKDSTGDGVGDFVGLRQKLDYLQDLGVTALWVLPFYPSPLKDDGYDIADYEGVNPSYGTLADFRAFLDDAHARGLRVITELVLNHTSDRHPWFQRARRAKPGSVAREFYVWSDTADRYRDARVIFRDFEASNWSLDPVANAWYWHRFYAHQPDLNFDNPAVRRAMLRVVDAWFSRGVDGLRLDAVPYLFEREGTSCENLPETHAFLRELRAHVDEKFAGRMLLAEANQWPEDASAYFGAGDECHMAFHFPLMPRLFMAIRLEERYPILDVLRRTPAIPDACQWALFLRNHDELTLEMVTDEERDYMVRSYAHDSRARINLGIRRRLAPLLGNNRRKIELMHGLLLSLPGTPVIYYGDEIGMGDNIYLGDRDSVRTPMQWSTDRNGGFSAANPQRLYLPLVVDPEFHHGAVNVEAQESNPQSLLWWMRRLIALRKRHVAFGRGTLEFLHPENRKVLAFLRVHEDQTILVVANLSRFAQHVALDLSRHADRVPVELFGRTRFPPVGTSPYSLTLGPHSFLWFLLEAARPGVVVGEAAGPAALPVVAHGGKWPPLPDGRGRAALDDVLAALLPRQPWYAGRDRAVRATRLRDVVTVGRDGVAILLVDVAYQEGEPDVYAIPVAHATGAEAADLLARRPQAVLARFEVPGEPSGLLYEASFDAGFAREVLAGVRRPRRWRGTEGDVVTVPVGDGPRVAASVPTSVVPVPVESGRSHVAIAWGERLRLELFARVDTGPHPDVEVAPVLAGRSSAVSPLFCRLEYVPVDGEPRVLGVVHGAVAFEQDAWARTRDAVGRAYERVVSGEAGGPLEPSAESVVSLAAREPSAAAKALLGGYATSLALLGRRVAEVHAVLASETADPAFAAEPVTGLYRRATFHAFEGRADRAMRALKAWAPLATEQGHARVERLVAALPEAHARFRAFAGRDVSMQRIRIHGDLTLENALWTGNDFVFTGFGGDPTLPLSERRIKRTVLRDLASLLRSLRAAATAATRDLAARGALPERPGAAAPLEDAGRAWAAWAGAAVLREYLRVVGEAPVLSARGEDLRVALDAYAVDHAFDEILRA
ncbi:MAG TPA: maltose alpha-D-glucosyltransferase, partial [Planctomycetota bacterium]|nr:maltose alpha-D-glucosyltransferase [Planctomycetota bacterium]